MISIDRVPSLALPVGPGRAEVIDRDGEHVKARLDELTDGRGPDRCIDDAGREGHAHGSVGALLDRRTFRDKRDGRTKVVLRP